MPLSSRFLLERAGDGQICSYGDHAAFEKEIDSLQPDQDAEVRFKGRHAVHVLLKTLTQDWGVRDDYTLAPSGEVQSLRREIGVIPGDLLLKQDFAIRGGVAHKIFQTALKLSTKGPRLHELSLPWYPDVPVATSVASLPFAPLLISGPGPQGVRCVPSPPAAPK